MEAKVTHLSADAFDRMFNEQAKRVQVIMQFLETVDRNFDGKPFKKGVFSNGFFKYEFFVGNQIAERFAKEVHTFDVLQVTVSSRANSSHVLLSDFTPIYQGLKEVVGMPIPFEKGRLNASGSNLISEVISKDAPKKPANRPNAEPLQGAKRMEIESEDEKPGAYYTAFIDMNPYDKDLTIKGRLMRKEQLRKYKNKQGAESSLFTVYLFDGETEVQGTFYGQQADQNYANMQEGEVYAITHVEPRQGDKFNTTKFKYTLSFGRNATVTKLKDKHEIAQQNFSFVPLNQINERQVKEKLDVVVIVGRVGELQNIVTKAGQKLEKREVTVYDDSNFPVKLQLWRENALNESFKPGEIVIIKNAQIEEYQGKNLGMSYSSQVITMLPDHPRVKEVIVYRQSNKQAPELEAAAEGKWTNCTVIEQARKMAEDSLRIDSLSKNYFSVAAYLTQVGNLPYYEGCLTEGCFKKVEKQATGYHCQKCNKTTQTYKPRFMTSVVISDYTGGLRISLSSDKICLKLYNETIDNIHEMVKRGKGELEELNREVCFRPYVFRIGARLEDYQGKQEVKFLCHDIYPREPNARKLVKQYFENEGGEEKRLD